MIGHIPAASDAERFSDYLLAQGVENLVEESAGSARWTVWIERDDDVERGKHELEFFLKNPSDPKYGQQSAGAKAAAVRKDKEVGHHRRRRQFIDVRTTWGQPQQWNVPVTIALLVLTIIVSIATNSIGLGGQPRKPVIEWLTYIPPLESDRFQQYFIDHAAEAGTEIDLRTGAPTDASFVIRFWLDALRRGEVWRVITPIFIHWSFLHLLFNLFWLRDLGGMIEMRRGSFRLLGIVVVAALISCLTEFLWELPDVGSFGGMSGVVYGLFGYVWVKDRFQPHLGLNISRETSMVMLAWLFLCMTGMIGPIANAAHVSGLVVGAATGWLPYQYKRLRKKLE
jgi:GlpG protein